MHRQTPEPIAKKSILGRPDVLRRADIMFSIKPSLRVKVTHFWTQYAKHFHVNVLMSLERG